MSSDFYIEYHHNYLLVQHAPDFEMTLEAMNKFWMAIAPACKILGCKRVIWEGKITGRHMNLSQIYASASQAGQVALGLKLACLFEDYTPDERTVFFKSVALRKGASIEFFSNWNEAVKWLGV